MWWVNFKYILLTEKSQPEKTAYYMIPIMLISGKGKTINSFFKKPVVARDLGVGVGLESMGCRRFVGMRIF